MNDPSVSTIAPICGDQDGSETPVVYNCSQFSQVVDRRYYQVPGSGPVQVHFDYVYRDAACNNELAMFRVDDTSGSINGVLPGDSAWPTQVASRNPQVVFGFGASAGSSDVDITFQGGDILALRFHACGGYSFYSFEQADADGYDHMLAFQNTAGQPWQFAWEDGGVGGFGGGDQDFNDMIVNLSAPIGGVVPPEQTFGSNVCRTGRGVHARSETRCLGDPVNSLTGAFIDAETDLSLPATGVSFSFTRNYTSADATLGRLGPGWTDGYSASLSVQPNGNVVLHGEDGQRVVYTKQSDGSFKGAAGASSTVAAVTGGYQLVTQDQVTYMFNGSGVLQSMRDRNGQGLSLAYDGSGKLTGITDSVGRAITLAYNASNLLGSVSVPDGRIVSYGYTNGRLTSVVDVRGKTWTYGYDGAGRLATIVDPLGHTQVANLYDATSGRVTQQTDAVGKTTTFAWDAATQTASVTDPNNKVWKDVYSSGNVLVKQIDPLNDATQFGPDGDINITTVSAPDGATTAMSYDTRGNLLTATAPASLDSVQKTFQYNSKNDPTSITDARGKLTTYGYDAAGNNTSVTQEGTTVATYTYDSAGRMLTFKDGNDKTTTYTHDANGNTASATDPLGNKTSYTYDDAGRTLTRTEPKGNVQGANPADFTWTYTYNAAGQVLTEIDPLGNTTTHSYDDAGNELSVTNARGKVTNYAFDNANRLVSVTAPDGGVTQYTYDNAGNKLTEKDALNHTTSYAYDDANQLASSTTATGAKSTFFYDGNGNQIKTIDPRGNVQGANPDDYATSSTYDAAGRLLTETDPLGHTTTHAFDAVGNEISVTDARTNTTTYAYDGKNRLLSAAAPDGGVSQYSYDNAGNKLGETDPRGNTTSYAYDGANRLLSVTQPDPDGPGPQGPPITTYGYDANGNQVSMVEPRGNVTGCGCASQYTRTYSYDRANRRTTETNPLGHITSSTYDAVGNTLTQTDANNHATGYSYDDLNRLLTVTAPDLSVTTYTYDLAGNLLTRKDANDHTTTYAHDADNQPTIVTTPLGQQWTTDYDPAGNVSSTIDANGNSTPATGDGTIDYTYDRAGRLTGTDYSDPATPDVTFGYDPAGNRTSMTDGQGTQTRTYDAVGRLSGLTRGSDTFSYQYDLAGNLTHRTYPGATLSDYAYDATGRMSSVTSQGQTTSYGYDDAGNLITTTLPSGNGYTETRSYDRAGRLTEIKTTRSAAVTASEPEIPNGLLQQTNLTGSLSAITDDPDAPDTAWMVASSSSVDGSARVAFPTPSDSILGTQTFKARVRKHGGSATPTARIDLYENGTLRASGSNQNVSSTSGQTITQTFNADTLSLADRTGAGIEARFVGTHVGTSKTVASVDLGALRWTATYVVSPQTLSDFSYTLDPVGNPTGVTTPTASIGYSYDNRDRLTQVCYRFGCPSPGPEAPGTPIDYIGWTYDGVGNRLTESRGQNFQQPSTTSYTYNAGDQLTQQSGASTASYTYDGNGNETTSGSRTFTYDEANRLRSSQQGSNPATYAYDGDGNRLQAAGTNYLWDVNNTIPQLALERDGTGSLLRRYTYGVGKLAMTTPAGTFYYHPDRLGSIRDITSSIGAMQWTYDYEPFGNDKTVTQHTPNAPGNPLKFTGEYLDATGLYHLRAREYDPNVGRFLTTDPAAAPLSDPSAAAYTYVDDRPSVLTDPSGEHGTPASVYARGLAASVTSPQPWACPSSANALVYPFDSGWKSFAFAGAVAFPRGARVVLPKGGGGRAYGTYYYVRIHGRAYLSQLVPTGLSNACIMFGLDWDLSPLAGNGNALLTLKYDWRDRNTGKFTTKYGRVFCDKSPSYVEHRVREGGPRCTSRVELDAGSRGYYVPKGQIPAWNNVDYYGIDESKFEPGLAGVIGDLRQGLNPLYSSGLFRFDRMLGCDLRQGGFGGSCKAK